MHRFPHKKRLVTIELLYFHTVFPVSLHFTILPGGQDAFQQTDIDSAIYRQIYL